MQTQFPGNWLDRVFGLMLARYGSAWTAKWAGIDMAAVRADWCNVLAGLQNRPEAVRYGLDNLPDAPPTAVQFRTACNRTPEPMPVALPAPMADPEVVAKVRGAFVVEDNDPKAWAHRLKAKEVSGYRLSPMLRASWREVLKS
jgi:hypothetical protein